MLCILQITQPSLDPVSHGGAHSSTAGHTEPGKSSRKAVVQHWGVLALC